MSVGTYLAQTKMENKGVGEQMVELLTAASLLDIDIYCMFINKLVICISGTGLLGFAAQQFV